MKRLAQVLLVNEPVGRVWPGAGSARGRGVGFGAGRGVELRACFFPLGSLGLFYYIFTDQRKGQQ